MGGNPKGSRFEREVEADLKARGYQAERISNSSGDAGDVWAVKHGVAYFVEAKASKSGHIAPEQWNRLYDAAHSAGARPVAAIRRQGRLQAGDDRIAYYMLTGRKDQRGPQPWRAWGA